MKNTNQQKNFFREINVFDLCNFPATSRYMHAVYLSSILPLFFYFRFLCSSLFRSFDGFELEFTRFLKPNFLLRRVEIVQHYYTSLGGSSGRCIAEAVNNKFFFTLIILKCLFFCNVASN